MWRMLSSGRLGEESVTEVEDMPGSAAGASEDIRRLLADYFGGAKQDGGVEISLHGYVMAQGLPRLVERYAPVEAHDVHAALLDGGVQSARAGGEVL